MFMVIIAAMVAAQSSAIHYNGKDYYINGINVPWNAYGSDVGTHYQWGALYSPSFFTTFFQQCQSYGINCVRLWIHCDGRTSPEFDGNGNVTGLDTNFFSNFDDIFRIAAANNVMIMPCLWSFDMTKDFTSTAGKYAGLHANLIQDTNKTRSYINNALVPMVKHYANTCNLFAWEIINEPEWSITGPGNTVQLVSPQEMERFCAMIAEAIHLNSGKMATVGSACLKWSSLRQPPAEAHYWCDSSFQAVYKKPKAVLDFYEIHYYDWMFNADWGYDPFQDGKTPAYWKLDKPTLIGECPGQAGPNYTVNQMIDSAYAHGYAGIMPWSYNANDGVGTWDACKSQLKAFHDAHASLVNFICNAGIAPGNGKNSSKPDQWALEVISGVRELPSGVRVKVYNMQGRLVWTRQAGAASAMAIEFSLKGAFLFQIIDGNDKVIFMGKSVKSLN
jgi:Cellulase (glycosyl hydrolase family 5)